MRAHNVVGAQMSRHITSRLSYPKVDTERIARLVEAHMFDLKGTETDETVRLFVLHNADIIEDLCELKNADYLAHGMNEGKNPSALRLMETYRKMLDEGVAFSVRELPVGGEDLIALNVPPQERSDKLIKVLEYFASRCVKADRQKALELIKN